MKVLNNSHLFNGSFRRNRSHAGVRVQRLYHSMPEESIINLAADDHAAFILEFSERLSK